MISGPLRVRSWWRSASKMTSLIQWSCFSIPQCPWTQVATCSGWACSMGSEQTRDGPDTLIHRLCRPPEEPGFLREIFRSLQDDYYARFARFVEIVAGEE